MQLILLFMLCFHSSLRCQGRNHVWSVSIQQKENQSLSIAEVYFFYRNQQVSRSSFTFSASSFLNSVRIGNGGISGPPEAANDNCIHTFYHSASEGGGEYTGACCPDINPTLFISAMENITFDKITIINRQDLDDSDRNFFYRAIGITITVHRNNKMFFRNYIHNAQSSYDFYMPSTCPSSKICSNDTSILSEWGFYNYYEPPDRERNYTTSQWNSVFRDTYSEVYLFDSLPRSYIIPLDKSFNLGCKDFNHSWFNDQQAVGKKQHAHEHIFHRFLYIFYHKTVEHAHNATVFYLPVYIHDCYPNAVYGTAISLVDWAKLERYLQKFVDVDSSNASTFRLDKTFFGASYPLDSLRMMQLEFSANRNLYDLRQLRVDFAFSSNGRDVIIPYYVEFSNHQIKQTHKHSVLVRRKGFLFAPCNSPIGWPGGIGMDFSRHYRDSTCDLLEQFVDASDTLISKTPVDAFFHALSTHDFCVILPGDTASTSKLFKAIFSMCIPVVFVNYNRQLPFSRILDWEKFSILEPVESSKSKNKIQDLMEKLRSLRSNETALLNMKNALKNAAPLFDYDRTSWPSVYHLTLLELELFSKLSG